MELPLDYMPNDHFARIRTEKQRNEVLGPVPPSDQPRKKTRLPSGLPPYLASLYEVPLLTREQETHLFRKMNFLKYQASKLRQELDVARPRSGLMDAIEKIYGEAVGHEKPDRIGQPTAGGVNRQAACGPDGEFLRADQRWQYLAD